MPLTGPPSHKVRRITGTILFILMVGAAGCAPAVSNVTPPAVEVDLDSLVAEAVETQRAETQQADENLSATLTLAAEQPLVLAAQTLTPTITSTPEATETPLSTLPTMELPATFTPTPPGIPDRNPQDPALWLGEPIWTDNFDGSDNWTEFTGTNSQIEVSDGQLRYTIFKASAVPTWTVSWPQLSNFYLEVLARTPTACSGKDRLGVIFRAPDPEHGYRLEISCDGQYRMLVFDQSGAQTIVAWASSEHLLAGPNQINRLGIWTEGKVIAIYLNGVNVAGLEHNDYRSGTFGFSVTSENTDNFTAAFDDLSFWSFP